jgi:hypothetical protein
LDLDRSNRPNFIVTCGCLGQLKHTAGLSATLFRFLMPTPGSFLTVINVTFGPKFSLSSALLLDQACFPQPASKHALSYSKSRSPDGRHISSVPFPHRSGTVAWFFFSFLHLSDEMPAGGGATPSKNSTRNLPRLALMHGSHVFLLFSKKHGSHNLVSLKPLFHRLSSVSFPTPHQPGLSTFSHPAPSIGRLRLLLGTRVSAVRATLRQTPKPKNISPAALGILGIRTRAQLGGASDALGHTHLRGKHHSITSQ